MTLSRVRAGLRGGHGRHVRAFVAALALAGPVMLTGCSGTAEEKQSPPEALAAARATLDETSGVRITLEVGNLPEGVDGLLNAEGVATHDPAFDGSIKVATGGVTADAAVIAADGNVFAILPFTTQYAEIDPADYAAPDPADLMSTEDGLSSLLTSAEQVRAGEEVREGEDVLSTYTGVLPGDAVAAIIPSARRTGEFDARFTLRPGNQLDEVLLTGPFYPGAGDVSYTIGLTDYGLQKDITAP
ncbi:N/A [soil metagenome]